MNCRTFQKQLEDYLENGLDFAGRFGMERHARQCVRCGREMADAQNLSRLVQGLDKVKAPPNFESSVLNEIGKRKLHRRFSAFRRILVFGFDMPSWRKYALASSVLIVFGLGILYWYNPDAADSTQGSVSVANIQVDGSDLWAPVEKIGFSMQNPVDSEQNSARLADSRIDAMKQGLTINFQTYESDYSEYNAIGPDNLPMIVPLPNVIRMQVVGSPSEEDYLTQFSH